VSKAEQHPPEWHEENAELIEPRGMLINGWVHDTLSQENFCGSEGRWSNGPADWFVIGGRWSGELVAKEFNTDFKGLSKGFKDKGYPKEKVAKKDWELFESKEMVSSAFVKSLKTELNLFWSEDLGGDEPHPWVRDSYNTFGYPDDSVKLTKNLFNNLFEGNTYSSEENWIDIDAYDSAYGQWSDLEQDIEKGEIWLTVIDYHC
tara:strand:+ start:666 stop:1277 length:612 start_codon:yes stop_codon:yes gene_type:complete